MKISYVHGPGNVYGTFKHWKSGDKDTSINKQTYSGQFFDLVCALDGQGQVVGTAPSGPTQDNKFQFHSIPRSQKSGWRHYLSEMEYARDVGKALRTFDPDIIIIASDFPSIFFDFLPRKAVKILSIHNTYWPPYGTPEGRKARLLAALTKWSLRDISLAVCVSRECQRQFQSLRGTAETFSVVQIPRIACDPTTSPTKTPGKPGRLLYVGRVEESKGVSDLIHAFANVRRNFEHLTLVIVGEGSDLEPCRKLAHDLGGHDAITFTGRLDATGVQNAYASADLCVCPTRLAFCEGLATVPIEAAACGIPSVISSAVPAKEYFQFDDLVFDAGDISDLAFKITRAISSEAVYSAAVSDAKASVARVFEETGDWKSGILRCINTWRGGLPGA